MNRRTGTRNGEIALDSCPGEFDEQIIVAADNQKQVAIDDRIPAAFGQEKKDGTVKPRIAEIARRDHEGRPLEELLEATGADLEEATELAKALSVEEVTKHTSKIYQLHKHDPNFPQPIVDRMYEFLTNKEVVAGRAQETNDPGLKGLLWEMSVQAALFRANSPYAAVRSVVENTDDPNMPCSTIRAWVIGVFISVIFAAFNQIFSIRQPSTFLDSLVAQFLAWPIGKAWDLVIPDWGVTLFGIRHSLTPCTFNKKEHMMTVLLAMSALVPLYTSTAIWLQVLYYKHKFAKGFLYQVLLGLSQSFLGVGLMGILRPVLVYPSHCIWFGVLTLIAMNKALHGSDNTAVHGPLKRSYSISRYMTFAITVTLCFIYQWVPTFLFYGISMFSWMTWISPDHLHLNIWTGFNNGLGLLNPFPTFDWTIAGIEAMIVPSFSVVNRWISKFFWFLVVAIIYYTDTWNTAYLPINGVGLFSHNATAYDIHAVITTDATLDRDNYMAYSAPYLSAGQVVNYLTFFAIPTSILTYTIMFQWYEVKSGLVNVWRSFRIKTRTDDDDVEPAYQDGHMRLISKYPEVSHWWFLATLIVSVALAAAALSAFPTGTNGSLVIFTLVLTSVFLIPEGIILATTGFSFGLGYLTNIFGGLIYPGNSLGYIFFQIFSDALSGDVLNFCMWLKLSQYAKIPPRHTVSAQVVGRVIGTIVCVSILRWQVTIPNVCTPDAPFRFYCPTIIGSSADTLLFGTLGFAKTFGVGSPYGLLLLGMPLGSLVVIAIWFAVKKFPSNRWLRQVHPALLFFGPAPPYSFAYSMCSLYISMISWQYLRKRYLGFWSKYNYVFAVAVQVGVGLALLLIFFSTVTTETSLNWWGNSIISAGCEGIYCTLKQLAEGEILKGWWNPNKLPIPGQ